MISLDFLITLLVVFGIARMIRMFNAPKASVAGRAQQTMNAPKPKSELHTPRADEKIIDATFEEID